MDLGDRAAEAGDQDERDEERLPQKPHQTRDLCGRRQYGAGDEQDFRDHGSSRRLGLWASTTVIPESGGRLRGSLVEVPQDAGRRDQDGPHDAEDRTDGHESSRKPG